MQTQCCSNWCWAAVLSSAVKAVPLECSAKEQAEFAEQLFKVADCSSCCPGGCADPNIDRACNKPADMVWALSQFNLSSDAGTAVDGNTFEDVICRQIDQNRPVIAEIDYGGGHGHILLIYGYDRPDTISFGDPADGTCLSVSFSTFCAKDAYVDPKQKSLSGRFARTYTFD